MALAVGGAIIKMVFENKEDRRNQTLEQIRHIDQRNENDKRYWDDWHRRNSWIPRHLKPEGRPLRLLALDGGGVRGIISLIILQQIMKEVAPNARPCDYFDLIGGTSTGGLIALMLGRLRMTIPQCIAAYREMSKDIFDSNFIVQAAHLLSAHRFSGEKLKAAVEEIVGRHRGKSSTAMLDKREDRPDKQVCRTFVVAVPGCNVQRPPKLFRTYNNRFQAKSADRCQIWEAARATACAPSFFPEICVDDVYYSDGGLGFNNPAQLVLDEARSLWGAQHPIDCLLSIGTGNADSFLHRFQYASDFLKVLSVFRTMALDCERVHQQLHHDSSVKPFYYRFNPTLTKKIGLDEWKKIEKMEGIAFEYLNDHTMSRKVTRCAQALS